MAKALGRAALDESWKSIKSFNVIIDWRAPKWTKRERDWLSHQKERWQDVIRLLLHQMLIAHFLNVVSQSDAMKISTSVSGPLSAVKSSKRIKDFNSLSRRRLNILEALEPGLLELCRRRRGKYLNGWYLEAQSLLQVVIDARKFRGHWKQMGTCISFSSDTESVLFLFTTTFVNEFSRTRATRLRRLPIHTITDWICPWRAPLRETWSW